MLRVIPARRARPAFTALAGVALALCVAAVSTGCGDPATTSTSSSAPPAPTTVTVATTTTTVASATTTSTVSAPTTVTTAASPTTALQTTSTTLAFDGSQAMAHIEKLSVDIGLRHAGTDAEMAAVEYGRSYLEGLGYAVEVADVPIPNGLTSHNVIAVKPGRFPHAIVVGAHIDSWGPSPGAGDNASGAASVLEPARDLKDAAVTPTIIFVLFGNEEMIDENPDHHHYGSRAYVAGMDAEERTDLVGMISLDMVAFGSTFTVRTMGEGPQQLRTLVKSYARDAGTAITYERDPAPAGWSDHEPFERAGYPAVWLEWRLDDTHHTARDTIGHLNAKRLQATGDFALGFLRSLDLSNLETLAQARTAK
jgi:aminopeptidase YwaD